MFLSNEAYEGRSTLHQWITGRLSAFLFSLAVGMAIFSITFPSYQTVIPYDRVVLDDAATGFLDDEQLKHRLKLDFRKTGCDFAALHSLMIVDGEFIKHTWYDYDGQGEKGNRPEGFHTLDIVSEIPKMGETAKDIYLLVMTDHECAEGDLNSIYVIENGMPALRSVEPDRINVSKVIAKIQLR